MNIRCTNVDRAALRRAAKVSNAHRSGTDDGCGAAIGIRSEAGYSLGYLRTPARWLAAGELGRALWLAATWEIWQRDEEARRVEQAQRDAARRRNSLAFLTTELAAEQAAAWGCNLDGWPL